MSAEDDMAWPNGSTIIPADPPSPRYIVDRETLIAAYESQAWSSPDQMADMLLDGLALASSPAPAGPRCDFACPICLKGDDVALPAPAPAGLDVETVRTLVATIDRLRMEQVLPTDKTDWQVFARESLALDKARAATRPAEEPGT